MIYDFDEIDYEYRGTMRHLRVDCDVVRETQGGLAAIILAWALYWTSEPREKHVSDKAFGHRHPWQLPGPRCRPQSSNFDQVHWFTSLNQLAESCGRDASRKSDRQLLHRALQQLSASSLAEYEFDRDPWAGGLTAVQKRSALYTNVMQADPRHRLRISVVQPISSATFAQVEISLLRTLKPNAAILFGMLRFLDRRQKGRQPGRPFTAGRRLLAKLTGLSEMQVRGSLKHLEKAKLVEKPRLLLPGVVGMFQLTDPANGMKVTTPLPSRHESNQLPPRIGTKVTTIRNR